MSTKKIKASEEQLSSGKSRANIANAGKVDGKASKDVSKEVIGSHPSPALAGKPAQSEGTTGSTSAPGREGVAKINQSAAFNQESKADEVVKSGLHNYGISSSNLKMQLGADLAEDVAFINTGVILGNRDKKYQSREEEGAYLENSVQDLNDMFFGASFSLTVKELPGPPNYAYRPGSKSLFPGVNASMPNIIYTGNISDGTWRTYESTTDGSSSRTPGWKIKRGIQPISALYQNPPSGSVRFNQFHSGGMGPIYSGILPPSGMHRRVVALKCPEDSSIRLDSVSESFSYSPNIHGRLAKITISETSWIEMSSPSGAQDKLATAGSGTNITAIPLVYQDETVYLGSGLYNGDSFAHWYPSGVIKEYEQKDFVAKDGSNPDFSDTGGKLHLGYSRSISQGTGNQYFTNLNALGEFSAVLVPSGLPKLNPYKRQVCIDAKMPNSSSGVKNVTVCTVVPHFKDGYDKVIENLIETTGE